MRLGVNVPNFGPGTQPESLAGWVRFAEGAGFSVAMMSDHVAVTPDVAEIYPPPFYDPFTTIAWLAAITERIELGTTVAILPYRHPLLTARVAASIDQLSRGRFVLGVGVGWSPQEYAALGVPFGRRGAITDEYLAAITALWSNDLTSYEGEQVSFTDVHTGPRPARRPHPPIWVGGASRAALRRTVGFGDAWHPNNAELGWLRDEGLPTLRSLAAAAGRAEPTLCPRMRLRLTETSTSGDRRRAGEGSMAQVLADIDQLRSLGAECLILDTNPDHPSQRRPAVEDWRMLESVAERVLAG